MNTHESADAVIRAFFRPGKIEHFTKGEVILHASEVPGGVHHIEAGFVKAYTITKDGQINLLSIHGASELFPAHWALDDYDLELYFEAMTDVTTKRLAKRDLTEVMASDAELTLAILQKVLILFQAYSERIQNLGLRTARQRIIYRLLFLARRFGEAGKGDEIAVKLPVIHQDIADAVSLQRETVNREISQLASEGLIEKINQHLTIKNLSSLKIELE